MPDFKIGKLLPRVGRRIPEPVTEIEPEPTPSPFDNMPNYSELHHFNDFRPAHKSRFLASLGPFPAYPVLRRKGDGVLLQCPQCKGVGDGTEGYACLCGYHLQIVEDAMTGEPKYVLVSMDGESE